MPTPAPTLPPVPEAEALVCAYSWDCATAMRIVDCETGGTFYAGSVGDYGERGLFQIHEVHWHKPECSGDLFDPAYNTACAYSIWLEQGWNPWSCWWR